jgi:predicted nucleic acid-binding protein
VTVYLDSSAVLRVLLRQAKPLAAWGRWHAAYSSELLGVEARRVIDRLRLQAALDDDDSRTLTTAWHGSSEASGPSP